MKEQLISFETAKLAKEKGYTSNDEWYYKEDGNLSNDLKIITRGNNTISNAPTQSLLQKWLREERKLFLSIILEVQYTREICEDSDGKEQNPHYVPEGWYIDLHNESISLPARGLFKTYEEALEEGLKQSLKLIK